MAYQEVTVSDGLSGIGTSTPGSEVLSTGESWIYDNTRFEAQSYPQGGGGLSYGVDLGSTKTIKRIVVSGLADITSWSGWYTGEANASTFDVYGSSDNSSWTFIETFDQPTILINNSDEIQFEMVLNSEQSYRYFKIWHDDSSMVNPSIDDGYGTAENWAYGEIEIYKELPEGTTTEGQGQSDTIEAFNLTDTITEGQALSDTIDAVSSAGYITEDQGLEEVTVSLMEYNPIVTEGQGQSDTIEGFNLSETVTEGQGLSDSLVRSFEVEKTNTEGQGQSDTVEAWNYSELVRGKDDRIIRRYYCTLTGAADSTTDLEIPISSFQSRLNNNRPSYLSIVTPTVEQSSEINSRSNGDIVIEIALLYNGEELFRQEIVRAELETITISEGAVNKSITLEGHGTRDYSTETVAVDDVISRTVADGKIRYQLGSPDLFLRPRNTVTYDSDSFEVGTITFAISVDAQTVTVEEA